MIEYLPAALLLLLALVGVTYAASRWPAACTTSILLLLLVHELIIRWATNVVGLSAVQVTSVSLWKDVSLLGLVVGTGIRVVRQGSPLRERFVWQRSDGVLSLFVILGALNAVTSPDKVAGLAAFRDYFEPLILFVVARTAFGDRAWTRKLLTGWLAVGLAMAALAIWQGVAWGAQEYVRWGFGHPEAQEGIPGVGILGQVRLRPPSTVTGPNELAFQLALMIAGSMLLLLGGSGARRYLLAPAVALFGAGVVLTASRSGFLGMLTALLVVLALTIRRRWRVSGGPISVRSFGVLAGGVVLALVALGALAALTGLGSHFVDTLANLGDQYHMQDTLPAIQFLLKTPSGVGMGMVGPRRGFGFPVQPAFHVEGSFFQIAMEFGIWGLAIFLIYLALAVWQLWQNAGGARDLDDWVLCGTATAGWLGTSVGFLFLPLMQALPLMAWLWFLMGVGLRAGEFTKAEARRGRLVGKNAQVRRG